MRLPRLDSPSVRPARRSGTGRLLAGLVLTGAAWVLLITLADSASAADEGPVPTVSADSQGTPSPADPAPEDPGGLPAPTDPASDDVPPGSGDDTTDDGSTTPPDEQSDPAAGSGTDSSVDPGLPSVQTPADPVAVPDPTADGVTDPGTAVAGAVDEPVPVDAPAPADEPSPVFAVDDAPTAPPPAAPTATAAVPVLCDRTPVPSVTLTYSGASSARTPAPAVADAAPPPTPPAAPSPAPIAPVPSPPPVYPSPAPPPPAPAGASGGTMSGDAHGSERDAVVATLSGAVLLPPAEGSAAVDPVVGDVIRHCADEPDSRPD